MARVIEDGGATADVSKPIKPPNFEPNRLPDPVTCNGAVITINDRGNDERPRLAIAIGGSWVRLAYFGEHATAPVQITSSPVNIDVTPMIRDAVRDMLPALVPRANPVAIAPPENNMDDVKNCARALIELADEMSRQRDEINSLRSIIDNARFPVPEKAVARLS